MSGVSISTLCDGPIALKVLGDKGYNGWSPILSVVSSGSQRFLRVNDWTGGEGTKPAVGYIGASGIVSSIGSAVDVGPSVFSRLDVSNTSFTASFRDDGAGNLGWYVAAAGAADGAQVKVATVNKSNGQSVFTSLHASSVSPQMGNATASFASGAFVHGASSVFWQTHESGAAANEKNWRLGATAGTFVLQALDDAYSAVTVTPITISRAGRIGLGSGTPAGQLHVALGTTPAWGGPWGSSHAVFGGGGVVGGAVAISYNDTDGGEVGSLVPGTTWKAMTIRGAGISFKPDGMNESLYIDTAGTARPGADNFFSLGSPSFRWSVVYAGTGTINTSDAREKTPVRSLSTAEIAAARDLAGEIGIYQWLASIEEKGEDGARRHIGLTVQRAIEIMQSHGLDPWRYGFICRDDITRKVKVKRAVTEQKTEPDPDFDIVVEVIDGIPTQVRRARSPRPVFEMKPLIGLDGGVVMQTVIVEGESGFPIERREPVLHPVPVMIEVTRDVEVDEPAGERLGFRYDQLTLFMLRGMLSLIEAQEA